MCSSHTTPTSFRFLGGFPPAVGDRTVFSLYIGVTPAVRICLSPPNGVVAQLVRASPCHGEGCGFESRQLRHFICIFCLALYSIGIAFFLHR